MKKLKYNSKWKPINEYSVFTDSDFDKRFEIDRCYSYETFFWKYRIRFVKYPPYEDLISVNILKLRKPTKWFCNEYFQRKFKKIFYKYCYNKYYSTIEFQKLQELYNYEI